MSSRVPHEKALDSTLAFLREGYDFIPRRCEKHGSTIFEARLLMEKTLFLKGEEAARVFYDRERFTREGAAPGRLRKTLFGEGGVQGLEGQAHRVRKQLFLGLMDPDRIQELVDLTRDHWRARLPKWEAAQRVVLFDEMNEIICQGVHDWVGLPLADSELAERTRELTLMIDSAGAIGVHHWKGRSARKRAERRLVDVIESVRSQSMAPKEHTFLHQVAWHREWDDTLLDARVAAVELLNVLRPVVAVSRYIVFAALAMHHYPEERPKLKSDGEGRYRTCFLEEVRRFYPFFPCLVARTRAPFDWQGVEFPEDRQVIFDLYGTNHDPDVWRDPESFNPGRFIDWEDSGFALVPQGGDTAAGNHRCPGERITLALMLMAIEELTHVIDYQIPEQDLSIPPDRMPTLPRSGLVLSHVRRQ